VGNARAITNAENTTKVKLTVNNSVSVFIGLGSNLADPITQIKQAISAISMLEQSQVIAVSSLYGSKPMGPADQPDYVNAVLQLSTQLAPLALLDALQHIENISGRVRKDQRWGPRTLDLDVLLYGQQIINNERLTVPHYGMKEREFVLIPLAEIAPELVLPSGEKLQQLLLSISSNGLVKLAE
jgi:2-amino-4-hydroxy-6-hydroxymethyldihydropteridine diphosphokinase